MLRDPAQLELLKPRKKHKYRAKKCTIDGHKFDSQAEAQRYESLKLLRDASRIFDLKVHPAFEIVVERVRICKYIADFSYKRVEIFNTLGPLVVEDVKSKPTARLPAFRLKMKLMKAIHGIDVRVIS